MRGSGTIWNGSAFSCASSSNEIYLLENNYIESPDTGNPLNSVTCNNGMIMGRVIQIDKGSYTSQLNVTISSDLIGKNVSCARSFESTTEIIGSSDRINISAGTL